MTRYKPAHSAWRVATDADVAAYGCRAGAGPRTPACGRRPVVAVLTRTHGRATRPWAYCAEHLADYGGLVVRDGAVVQPVETGGDPS